MPTLHSHSLPRPGDAVCIARPGRLGPQLADGELRHVLSNTGDRRSGLCLVRRETADEKGLRTVWVRIEDLYPAGLSVLPAPQARPVPDNVVPLPTGGAA